MVKEFSALSRKVTAVTIGMFYIDVYVFIYMY